jgi:hypothetical protein
MLGSLSVKSVFDRFSGRDDDARRAPRSVYILVRRDFVGAEQQFAAGAINDKAPAGLTAFQHGGNGATPDLGIDQDPLTGRIILAVRRLLEKPPQHAGPCFERCDTVGIEVVAGAHEIDIAGSGIVGADEDQAGGGIEGGRHPGRVRARGPGVLIKLRRGLLRRDVAMERHSVGCCGSVVALPAVFLGGIPPPYLRSAQRVERTYEGAPAEIGIYPRRAHIDAGGDARLTKSSSN